MSRPMFSALYDRPWNYGFSLHLYTTYEVIHLNDAITRVTERETDYNLSGCATPRELAKRAKLTSGQVLNIFTTHEQYTEAEVPPTDIHYQTTLINETLPCGARKIGSITATHRIVWAWQV